MKLNPQIFMWNNGLEVCHFKNLNSKFSPHYHEHYLIGCLLNGRRHFFCAGKNYIIDKNTLIMVNPGQIHACQSLDNHESEWLCIHIQASLMKNFVTSSNTLPNLNNIFNNPVLVGIFLNAIKSNGQIDASIFKDLLFQLIQNTTNTPTHRTSDSFAQIIENMRLNPVSSRSLSGMARESRINKYDFIRKFNLATGMTPWRYLIVSRLNHARKLLQAGHTIADAAIDAGFYDQSHLNKYFRLYFGFTPKAWQQASALQK